MRRINRLKGYRALQTIISNQSTITRTIEALPPDRLHMVTHGQGFVNESIVISNTVYARQATGPWQKFQAESAASAAAPLANGENNAVLSSETQFGQAEEKTIDGVLMRAYRSEAGSAQAGGANIQTVWVGVQDGLVHRAETLLSVQSAGQKITTQSTIVYYDLDAPDIVIEPPIP
ncbi:MAG TPA: hypothetical protein VHP11_00990 [Tepidisphaeraceae bacterium]|nr:hypothetical protein [Tepidisphaeraceae bacterium]